MSCGEGSGAVILRRCEADSQASGNIWNVSHPSSSLSKTIIPLDTCEAHETDSYEEKAMAPRSSALAWRIPWMEEPGGLRSMGSLRVGHERLHFHFSLSCIGEGNGNPLQYSRLENPMDGGAWQATVREVAKSWTQLSN